MPRKRKVRPAISLGGVTREDLPYPYVHYPGHYGAFISFSETTDSEQAFCLCCKPAIENYLQLRKETRTHLNADPLRMAPFESFEFSEGIAQKSLGVEDPLSLLKFEPDICHRCNMATPSLRYCHEMYGGEFAQHFGWYINQTYWRLGIQRFTCYFLKDVCPIELQDDLLRKVKMEEQDQLSRKEELAKNGFAHYHHNKDLSRLIRSIENKIENITREEFGFRKVGDRWISETMLYQVVQSLFPDDEVLRHYRPDFLNGLELDIYLPSLKIALEYQGQQHFHAIKAWGGEKALANLQKRDALKAKICKESGIKLLIIDYTDPITKSFVKNLISPSTHL